LDFVQENFGLENDPDELASFWNTFYSVYMVWATLTLIIMVPVLSRMFSFPDSVFLILSGTGSFFRALIFLTAPDINTLNAVFILGSLKQFILQFGFYSFNATKIILISS
jgi:hypothetical protein